MAGKKNRNKYINIVHFKQEVSEYTKIEYESIPEGWRTGYRLKGRWTTNFCYIMVAAKLYIHAYFENKDDAFWFTMQMGK